MQVIEAQVAGEVRRYRILIGGEWVDAQSGRTFESINPYTGKTWAVVLPDPRPFQARLMRSSAFRERGERR
jgi:acyl-CoA reductase-like NAD-dependent aldehyde dehydrogenase